MPNYRLNAHALLYDGLAVFDATVEFLAGLVVPRAGSLVAVLPADRLDVAPQDLQLAAGDVDEIRDEGVHRDIVKAEDQLADDLLSARYLEERGFPGIEGVPALHRKSPLAPGSDLGDGRQGPAEDRHSAQALVGDVMKDTVPRVPRQDSLVLDVIAAEHVALDAIEERLNSLLANQDYSHLVAVSGVRHQKKRTGYHSLDVAP